MGCLRKDLTGQYEFISSFNAQTIEDFFEREFHKMHYKDELIILFSGCSFCIDLQPWKLMVEVCSKVLTLE